MDNLLNFTKFLERFNLSGRQIEVFDGILVAIIVVAISVLSYYITKYFITIIVKKIISKSKNDYDDIFVKKKVFDSLSHIVPAIILSIGLRYVTSDENLIAFIQKLIYSYLIIASLIVISRFLNAINDIYEIYASKKDLSIQIKQYMQVLKIVFASVALIFIVAIVLDKKPGALFAGLGAMTAVLMLVFKDSIMSLVATVQISAYDLIKVGDWITIPSKEVDGDIMDISLNSIKIRNFDKTISTIPTYSIVQVPFINWRGMSQSGGRRIKRSINIDVDSISLCDKEMIEKFKNIDLITDYVVEKQSEIDKWNKDNNIKPPVSVNGRALTNLGVFRKYIENYLKSNFRVYKKYGKKKFNIDGMLYEYFVIDNPDEFKEDLSHKVDKMLGVVNGETVIILLEKFLLHFSKRYILNNGFLYRVNREVETVLVKGVPIEKEWFEKEVVQEGLFCDDLTVLVRQLPVTDHGLPVEVYVFAATTAWGEYEEIQSNLFDHILASMKEFNLELFQQPSSTDFKQFLSPSN